MGGDGDRAVVTFQSAAQAKNLLTIVKETPLSFHDEAVGPAVTIRARPDLPYGIRKANRLLGRLWNVVEELCKQAAPNANLQFHHNPFRRTLQVIMHGRRLIQLWKIEGDEEMSNPKLVEDLRDREHWPQWYNEDLRRAICAAFLKLVADERG